MSETENKPEDKKEVEEDDVQSNYKPPKKKTIEELAKLDSEDESLRKYKEALLGEALKGGVSKDDDPRRVVIQSFGLIFPKKDHDPITKPLDTKEQIAALKNTAIVVKEGTDYQFEVKFKVQHDIVSGLRFNNTVYKTGIKLESKSHMMGSYGPGKVHTWKSPVFTAPSGLLARGTYKAKTKFIDDDKTQHLEIEYSLKIATKWDDKQ